MNKDNSNSENRNRPSEMSQEAKTEKDLRRSEKDLGPQQGMKRDPFPESGMHKDQRGDTEQVEKKKEDSNIEELAKDVEGTVGSRTTGSSPDDIAGVSDLDRGMRRSRRGK